MATKQTMNKGTERSAAGDGGQCTTCGLPRLLCACQTLDAQATVLRVRLETRRYGKTVTVVGPFVSTSEAHRLATRLKRSLATGGTAKDHDVELQGDLARRARAALEAEGFLVE